MGFDTANPQEQAAPVSTAYPPPYTGSPASAPAPYQAAPYQGYQQPGAPPSTGPSQYNPQFQQNNRHHSRGGFHNNSFRGRPQSGRDKMHHKKPGAIAPSHNSNQHHQKPDAATAGKKKKRKTNTLGLTPGDDSDNDDVDEEKMLQELIGDDAPK